MQVFRVSYLLSLIAVAAVLVGSARAEDKPAVAGKVYEIDTEASKVFVKVGSATRLGHPHGVEGAFKSGKLTLGGTGEFVFDMASFTADTANARNRVGLGNKKVSENEAKKVTAAMRGADVLDVNKYPTATFRIAMIKPVDKQAAGAPGGYQLDGTFTLHGSEQKLSLKADVAATDKPDVIKVTGSFRIRQTVYGITPYSAAGGLAKVADELEISGDLVLKATK